MLNVTIELIGCREPVPTKICVPAAANVTIGPMLIHLSISPSLCLSLSSGLLCKCKLNFHEKKIPQDLTEMPAQCMALLVLLVLVFLSQAKHRNIVLVTLFYI